jgi:hypothetical protein
MPVCNRCGDEFYVEYAPGALMFGHPSTVREAVPVWKAHICQPCETAIVADWKHKPIEYFDEMRAMIVELKYCAGCRCSGLDHEHDCHNKRAQDLLDRWVIDIHYTAHGAQIETEHGTRIAA